MGPISGSHQGPQPQRLHQYAGYMAAPVSFREKVRVFPLQSGRRPYMCHARKERAEVNGTDQRITSGPAATTAAWRGGIHGCTRHARKERAEVNGTDQRITSGPAATTAASRGRIHGCTRIVSRKGQSLSLAKRAPSIHVPREERTRGSEWDRSADHIRARSHNGCIERPDTWLHPYRFAKRSESFPCKAGAVHTCATRGKNARK